MMRSIGFKQMCIQSESLCATFGAGLSTACVIDLGASSIKVSCVDDGIVLPETRLQLAFGGDDITALTLQVLLRAHFPYTEINLNRTYDWQLIELIKETMTGLNEAYVGLNLYSFEARRPGKRMAKYSLRLFDEAILAPLVSLGSELVYSDR